MGGLEELSRLFSELSVAIRCPDDGEAAESAAFSLVERLNPNPDPTAFSTRVLDAVLSQMCFGAREVYGSAVDYIVKTLLSVLSSSVYCDVLRGGEGSKKSLEILRVGSCICLIDNEKLIRACIEVLRILKGHVLFRPLVCAVLKVAVSASNFQSLFPMSSLYYENHGIPRISEGSAILEMQSLLPEETCENMSEISFRSFLWYLDPSLFKDEVSNLLKEVIQRPFLCLKDEFYERTNWRILMICLVTSPTAFKQTRALLHNWFLITGLASIIDLQIALVSSSIHMLSRPMWWGLSMELSLKLPFLHAYFPIQQTELLCALTEPVSCDGLLNLVKLITKSVDWSTPRIDCNSTWAISMNFPTWFFFAAALIFIGDKIPTQFRFEIEVTLIREAASKYLALVLSHPLNEESFNKCCHILDETSKSWMKIISSSNSRIKKRKASAADGDESRVAIWLRKFHKCYEEFCITIGQSKREIRTMEIVDQRSSLLFRRVPLGVLISHSSFLEEREFALLFDYAATGEIVPERNWPVRGAALVFSLCDYLEEIAGSLFDQEDEGRYFVRLMKSKSASYLLRCVRKLLQEGNRPGDDGGERDVMWKDLKVRLCGWKDHGAFSDILDEIGRR